MCAQLCAAHAVLGHKRAPHMKPRAHHAPSANLSCLCRLKVLGFRTAGSGSMVILQAPAALPT